MFVTSPHLQLLQEVWYFVSFTDEGSVTQMERCSQLKQLESGEDQSVFIHSALALLEGSLLLTEEGGG